ncbi:MAG: hypothetical protein JWN56_1374 [Sphingobacteriales bacterium]|nr:hypothetical protein [Sphingobacteriales bacterium]
MNFLSHFYFDRDTTDPNLVVGIVLPDLVKNVNKAWNLHPEKTPELFQLTRSLESIFSGWKRHIKVDKYFHSSTFFSEHTDRIKRAVLPVLQNSPVRPSFLAHITLELLLDSLLITEEVLDAHDFYSQLKTSDREALEGFLLQNNVIDTANFFKFFDEFIEASYLHSYREPKSIVYALNRICMRLWKNPLTVAQKDDLKLVLIDYKEYLRTDYLQIFEDISVRLT